MTKVYRFPNGARLYTGRRDDGTRFANVVPGWAPTQVSVDLERGECAKMLRPVRKTARRIQ